MRLVQMIGLAAVVAGFLAACGFGAMIGSGKSISEQRKVSGFTGVELSFLGDMTITQGDEEALVITGDDNIVPIIDTKVDNGVLRISTRPATIAQTIVPLRYALTVKNLDRIDLSGVGNIDAGKLDVSKLTLAMSGAGNINIGQLKADELNTTLSGLGNANIAGEVDKQTVTISGAGNYFANELRSGVASITDSGLGNAELWVTEKLQATISGAGNIQYYGKPEIDQTISGVGSIKGLGDK